MGGALHRIEVLLIGLVLLIAGAIVALVTVVHPVAPAATSRTGPTAAAALIVPTAEPSRVASAAPAAQSTPIAPTVMATASTRFSVPEAPSLLWPILVLAAGCLGLLLAALRARRRRMPYTQQNVGQLLATADAATRATNMRVMQALAEQGVLTQELAAAAGIALRHDTRWRWKIRFPRLGWPTLTLPAIRWPSLRLTLPASTRWSALRWQRLLVATRRIGSRTAKPVIPGVSAQPARSSSTLANQPLETPSALRWTAEDRVLAVATALTELWTERRLRSRILAFDTLRNAESAAVLVTIDLHPDEDEPLTSLHNVLLGRRPSWRASWRRNHLEIVVASDGEPPTGGPLLIPVLAHGRRGMLTRYIPLASWPHLGIYGGAALGALHAILGSLLYSYSPAELALAIIDHGEIASLYRDVTRVVPLPDAPHATIELLGQLIRRGTWSGVRRLLLVVIEPDDALLGLLLSLHTRLQARPDAPLHLIIVQERPRGSGSELYAVLPALLTGGAASSATPFPGQHAWPKAGAARLLARGMRLEGRAVTLDESAFAALLAQLPGTIVDAAPVIWDAPKLEEEQAVQPAPTEAIPEQHDQHFAEAAPSASKSDVMPAEDDFIDQRRRLFGAITRHRQQLLTAEDAKSDVAGSPAAATSAPPDEAVAVTTAPAASPALSDRAKRLRATLAAGELDAPRIQAYTRPSNTIITHVPVVSQLPTAMPEERDNGWPAGPAPLGRVALAELMARVVVAPAIVSGPANERGVTKNRLIELLKGTHRVQAKELAETLLAWFDQAGVLVEPTRPGRLRHPQALATTDLAELAARLTAQACPDQQTVSALWADSTEGSS
jgi:hypothetical protein